MRIICHVFNPLPAANTHRLTNIYPTRITCFVRPSRISRTPVLSHQMLFPDLFGIGSNVFVAHRTMCLILVGNCNQIEKHPTLLSLVLLVRFSKTRTWKPLWLSFHVKIKSESVLSATVLMGICSQSSPNCGDSRVVCDHTVLPQLPLPAITPAKAGSRLVRLGRDERLSWPKQVDANILLKDIPRWSVPLGAARTPVTPWLMWLIPCWEMELDKNLDLLGKSTDKTAEVCSAEKG